MHGPWFSHNGELKPISEAHVSLDDVNFTYGYGVYETLKVRKGLVFFADQHARRLIQSARIIGLQHGFAEDELVQIITGLASANKLEDANLKVLLIGKNPERPWGSPVPALASESTEALGPVPVGYDADLYVMALNPLFPKRQEYRDGTVATVFCGERNYPMAKSLNMLVSTMAFREARAKNGYDAILMDRNGYLREGTRTNLFYTDGETIFTPPFWTVLEGVTRHTILECCREKSYTVMEQDLALADLFLENRRGIKGVWLSSTSTKIMPIRQLVPSDHNGPGGFAAAFGLEGAGFIPWTAFQNASTINLEIPPIIHDLMRDYDAWLDNWVLAHR